MSKIVLYRYHDNIKICSERLDFIKLLNPDVKLYGLYGGKEEDFPEYDKALGNYFEINYCIKNRSAYWKWKNSDLAYIQWYKDIGRKIDFEALIVLEWDIIICEPLEKAYSHIQNNELGLVGLTPLPAVEKRWFWTRKGEERNNWLQLLNHAKTLYQYDKVPYAALGPGPFLPKSFLEQYSQLEIPEYAHDELRLPLFAQILKFTIKDIGFHRKWFSKRELKYFSCSKKEVSLKTIMNELSKSNGRRAFHPFREHFPSGFFDMFPLKNKYGIRNILQNLFR